MLAPISKKIDDLTDALKLGMLGLSLSVFSPAVSRATASLDAGATTIAADISSGSILQPVIEDRSAYIDTVLRREFEDYYQIRLTLSESDSWDLFSARPEFYSSKLSELSLELQSAYSGIFQYSGEDRGSAVSQMMENSQFRDLFFNEPNEAISKVALLKFVLHGPDGDRVRDVVYGLDDWNPSRNSRIVTQLTLELVSNSERVIRALDTLLAQTDLYSELVYCLWQDPLSPRFFQRFLNGPEETVAAYNSVRATALAHGIDSSAVSKFVLKFYISFPNISNAYFANPACAINGIDQVISDWHGLDYFERYAGSLLVLYVKDELSLEDFTDRAKVKLSAGIADPLARTVNFSSIDSDQQRKYLHGLPDEKIVGLLSANPALLTLKDVEALSTDFERRFGRGNAYEVLSHYEILAELAGKYFIIRSILTGHAEALFGNRWLDALKTIFVGLGQLEWASDAFSTSNSQLSWSDFDDSQIVALTRPTFIQFGGGDDFLFHLSVAAQRLTALEKKIICLLADKQIESPTTTEPIRKGLQALVYQLGTQPSGSVEELARLERNHFKHTMLDPGPRLGQHSTLAIVDPNRIKADRLKTLSSIEAGSELVFIGSESGDEQQEKVFWETLDWIDGSKFVDCSMVVFTGYQNEYFADHQSYRVKSELPLFKVVYMPQLKNPVVRKALMDVISSITEPISFDDLARLVQEQAGLSVDIKGNSWGDEVLDYAKSRN